MRTILPDTRFHLLFLAGTLVLSATTALAEQYDFLEQFEDRSSAWSREITTAPVERVKPLAGDLQPFYEDFARDGEVTLYIGYGYEAWSPNRATSLYNMMLSLASAYGLRTGNWQLKDQKIRFTDLNRNIKYRITVGGDRESFINAFANHEVVLYNGHSRYGRGPAFGSFTNYFRMGNVYKKIEVDTRNPYFLQEPMLLTDRYPPLNVILGGWNYQYQYRGQKSFSSNLPADAYTKNIPGMDTDLRRTTFSPGRQIIYLYSCKNIEYWKTPLRTLLPDPTQKFIFGTDEDGYAGTKPDAVMVMSIVRRLIHSDQIVRNLNATGDCANC
ncbi:MAG TPA: hypothetical protein DCS07_18070, partial [Bdellovibrionales bacterium]|nr:hypothetical protein [Bdellovibrionales bacterium]